MNQPTSGPEPDTPDNQVPYGVPRARPVQPEEPGVQPAPELHQDHQPTGHPAQEAQPQQAQPQQAQPQNSHPAGTAKPTQEPTSQPNQDNVAQSPDWVQRIRNLALSDTSVNQTTLVRTGLALLSLLGFLLPWVTMDGSSSSHSGAELILHSFTGPERGALARVTLLGALSLLFVPPVSAVLTIIIFFRTLSADRPMVLNILAIFLPALLLFLATPIVSTTHPTVMGVLLPSWGIALTMLSQAALLAHAVREELRGARNIPNNIPPSYQP